MDAQGFGETADLAALLYATGSRVSVEALDASHAEYRKGDAFGVLVLAGKGGHERMVPVVDQRARDILGSQERMGAIRSLSANAHRWRWSKGVAALGINSALATFHALRHTYACEAYRKSGGDLAMVQMLLGHADPSTTARYLHTSLGEMAEALQRPREGL